MGLRSIEKLVFEQGLVHNDYLFHLYELFKGYCLSAPSTSNRLPDKRTGNVYTRVTFNTMALPCFKLPRSSSADTVVSVEELGVF